MMNVRDDSNFTVTAKMKATCYEHHVVDGSQLGVGIQAHDQIHASSCKQLLTHGMQTQVCQSTV